MEIRKDVLEKYDIRGIFAKNLIKIQGFKIVCICDDSTSMREILNKGQTKWDELKQSIEIVLDIANSYNADCDVLFLNRKSINNVKSISQLNEQFSTNPEGGLLYKKIIFNSLKSSCCLVLSFFNHEILQERFEKL